MIDIYRDNNLICQIPDDNAEVDQALMGKDEITVNVVMDRILPVKVKDYINYNNSIYKLNREPEFCKKSDVEYSYSFVFEGYIYELLDKLFINPLTNQSKFYLTGTLRDFLEMLVTNISEFYNGWTIGQIPNTERKNILFESLSCREVLDKLKEEYKLEYYLEGRKMNFTDRFMNITSLSFKQGRGNGLYSIEQENIDSEDTITRAYIFGGTQNLPPARPASGNQPARPPYRNGEERLRIDERYLEDTSEFNKIVEKDVFFDDVFPRFEGTVESVEGDFNRIIHCSKIDFDITKQLIGGITAKINFLTGDLMGIPFELNPTQNSSGHSTTINLVRKEDETALADDQGKRPLIPNDLRKVQVGDKFNFTDIIMPDSYVINAENELRKKGEQWLDFYKQLRVKYTLSIDHRYLRKKKIELSIGKVLNINLPDKNITKKLRIISLKKNLHTGKITCEVSNYDRDKWDDKTPLWKPFVDKYGNMTWNLSYKMEYPLVTNIFGKDGITWKPTVDPEGKLSWSKDSSLVVPPTTSIKGLDGKTPLVSIGSDYKLMVDGVSIGEPLKGQIGKTWKPVLNGGKLAWTDVQTEINPGEMKVVPTLSMGSDYKLLVDGVSIGQSLKGESTYSLTLSGISPTEFIREGQPFSFPVTASLYYGQTEITDTIHSSGWVWKRKSENTLGDPTWDLTHRDTGNTITITEEDIVGDTRFTLDVYADNGELLTTKKV